MNDKFSFKLEDFTSIGDHTVILGTAENEFFSGWIKNSNCAIKVVPVHSSSLKLRDIITFEVIEGNITETEVGSVFVECENDKKAIA